MHVAAPFPFSSLTKPLPLMFTRRSTCCFVAPHAILAPWSRHISARTKKGKRLDWLTVNLSLTKANWWFFFFLCGCVTLRPLSAHPSCQWLDTSLWFEHILFAAFELVGGHSRIWKTDLRLQFTRNANNLFPTVGLHYIDACPVICFVFGLFFLGQSDSSFDVLPCRS